jgi:hypothetical protein
MSDLLLSRVERLRDNSEALMLYSGLLTTYCKRDYKAVFV